MPGKSALTVPDVDTAKLRARLNMSQSQFASAFPGLNMRTLQNWERGMPKSDLAKAYLHVIAVSPTPVRKFWQKTLGGKR